MTGGLSFSLENARRMVYSGAIMKKKLFATLLIVSAIAVMPVSASWAAQKETFGSKVKSFWKNLISYPGRVLEESASVVAGVVKNTASVVSNTTKRVGEVTTGDLAKTKELVTEPITGTAQTVVAAGEGTIKVPSQALKDKQQEATQPAETEKQ